jgi:hypothetical protein
LVSVVDFLSKSSRLLISADAGFGKTTLLKWIAVHASQADFSANLQGMNEKVPIFIRLRSFAKEDSKLPTPLDFLKDSAPNSSEEASKGWITKKLRNGKAIILIDGLDEVGINRREQVFDWLHGLLEGFEQSTFIVTTRPYVLDQDASNYFAKKGFQAASIQRLSEMGTNELIDNWYKAVAIEEDANEQEQEQLSMLANKLKEQLTFNDSLKQLARIPLLTAILCALNRQYQRSLPEDRITLYEKCIETLLEGREKARNISLPDYPDLPLQVKQELMSSLAYWMLRNNYLGEASAAEAEKHFDSILQQLGQGITGHDALMLFKDRLSFLHSPTYENVGFIHRSFQDYFSSREIVKIRDFGNLLEHIEDDNWRDVLILTAGQASQPDLTQILDRVFSLAKLKKSVKARRGLQLLGLSCLERKPRMTELLEQQVLACFEELQFPHSKEETFLFSNVGNLAIHSLNNRPNLSNAQKALCIDTLALIGSTAAFDEISKYSKEKDWEVVNSLGFAIRYFDKVKYSKKVLSINILTSHKLVVPSTSLFSDIIQHINLVHLKELDIKSGDNFEILYSISDNSEIQSLYINNNPTLTDISPVKSLKHLRSLDIRNNFNLREISPLSTLENLDYLDIRANSNLLNIAPLGSLSSLRVLDLRSCPRIKNFNVIAKLVNLESLDLRNNPQLSNVDFLERLPKLKTLYLGNNPLIKELSVILNLPILEWLWVDKDLKVPISLESKINVFRS